MKDADEFTCWTNNQDRDLSKSRNQEPLLNNDSSEEGNKTKLSYTSIVYL